jgi:hypothetical protein
MSAYHPFLNCLWAPGASHTLGQLAQPSCRLCRGRCLRALKADLSADTAGAAVACDKDL